MALDFEVLLYHTFDKYVVFFNRPHSLLWMKYFLKVA